MIDKTAIINKDAKVHSSVKVGPYSIIGPNVEIGENTEIQSHVSITGNTKIGKENKIYPFVSINDPQDLKYNGEETTAEIGDNTTIRECVTINRGTKDRTKTIRVGDEVASKKVVTITNRMEMVGVADCSRTILFQYSRAFVKQTWDDHNTLEIK